MWTLLWLRQPLISRLLRRPVVGSTRRQLLASIFLQPCIKQAQSAHRTIQIWPPKSKLDWRKIPARCELKAPRTGQAALASLRLKRAQKYHSKNRLPPSQEPRVASRSNPVTQRRGSGGSPNSYLKRMPSHGLGRLSPRTRSISLTWPSTKIEKCPSCSLTNLFVKLHARWTR